MTKISFLCAHNPARSKMAEAFLRKHAGDRLAVESAGFESGTLNVYAVRAMAEPGIEISGNQTKTAFDFYKAGRSFRGAVSVCSNETADRCPIFPGLSERHHWPLSDLSAMKGSEYEIMAGVRRIRDRIENAVKGIHGQPLNEMGKLPCRSTRSRRRGRSREHGKQTFVPYGDGSFGGDVNIQAYEPEEST